MEIRFDGTILSRKTSGIERVVRCLIEALAATDGEHRLSCYVDPACEPGLPAGIETIPAASGYHMALHALRSDPPDVYHLGFTPDRAVQLLPLALAKRSVTTMHDVIAIRRRYIGPEEIEQRKRLLKTSMLFSQAVHADSENTKRDLEAMFPELGADIRVLPPGVADCFFRAGADDERATLARLGVSPPYLLFVGKNYPHKNVPAMVEAFRTVRAAGKDVRLVWAGEPCGLPGVPDPEELARRAGVAGSFVRLGHVDDNALAVLYRQSEMLVFPSDYEGFGLPVLEAMACGTPVIAVNATSIPEVAGDAAYLVDETNPDTLSKAILEAMDNRDLRGRLIERGRKRAALFTWAESARRFLELYESLPPRAHEPLDGAMRMWVEATLAHAAEREDRLAYLEPRWTRVEQSPLYRALRRLKD